MTFIYLFFTKPFSRVFSPKGLNRLVAIALLYLTAEESFWFVARSFFKADFCRYNGLLSLSLRNISAFIVVVALTTGIVMVTPMTITRGW